GRSVSSSRSSASRTRPHFVPSDFTFAIASFMTVSFRFMSPFIKPPRVALSSPTARNKNKNPRFFRGDSDKKISDFYKSSCAPDTYSAQQNRSDRKNRPVFGGADILVCRCVREWRDILVPPERTQVF